MALPSRVEGAARAVVTAWCGEGGTDSRDAMAPVVVVVGWVGGLVDSANVSQSLMRASCRTNGACQGVWGYWFVLWKGKTEGVSVLVAEVLFVVRRYHPVNLRTRWTAGRGASWLP